MIPNGWKQIPLGDFITLQRGHDLPTSLRHDGYVPVMGSAGISGYHNIAKATGPGVTIGRSGVGSMGVVSYCPVDYWPLNTTLYVINFYGNHPRYAYYFLQTLNFRQLNSGSAQASLNRNIVHRIPINVPPLSEQRAIAHILGSLDDKIELNRQMNATLEAIARALFQSWFVDFDPVHAKAQGQAPAAVDEATAALFPDSFEETAIKLIPKGWNWLSLSDVCEAIFSGGTPSTSIQGYWNGEISWLSSGETGNKFIIETEQTITPIGVANSSTRLARAGSIVIASAGQGKTRGQTSLLLLNTYINQSVIALNASKQITSDLYLFFNLSRRYEEFRQISDSHSSRGSLTTKLLGNLQIVVPQRELIIKFDQITKPLVDHIYQNLQQSRTLAELRDTLLPKLMSGQLRVPEAVEMMETIV